MYGKRITLLVLAALLVLPLAVSAQESPAPVPLPADLVQQLRVDHDGVHFRFDALLASAAAVADYPATVDDVQIPSPAYTQFTLEGYAAGEYLLYAPGPRIDIFRIEDFGPYQLFITQLDELSKLLAERPDLNRYVTANPGMPDAEPLPFLPPVPAAQVLRAHPAYIELANIRGIRYLVYYSQAPNNIVEGELFYTFQGITADGQHYVSAVLPVNTGTISAEAPLIDDPDAWIAQYQQYLQDVLGTVTAADPQSFSPSLSDLDRLVQSIEVRR